MSVSFCSILSEENIEDLDGEIELNLYEEENKLQAVVSAFLKNIFMLFKRTLSPKLDRVTFCQNIYMAALLNAFGLRSEEAFNEDQQELRIDDEGIQKCKELAGVVFNQLKPIKKNVSFS